VNRLIPLGMLGALLAAGSAAAQTAGDPDKGAAVFAQCRLCHSLDAGKNGTGPSLHGLFGRKAGSVTGFAYSAAMKQSGVVWSDVTLRQYLADPKGFIPGGKKAIAGIKDPAKLDDVIAYLKQATP
jgi:cytochrome c